MLEDWQTHTTEVGFAPDTIFAPATGSGQAAIAVIRISGPRAHDALRGLTGRSLPPVRMLALRDLREVTGTVIDRAMVVAFPEGESYTGEAMAEIHCHGGRAVVSDLLAELSKMPDFRLAREGEFTQRAFFGGRMDLSEAEGLADLISAETTEQRRQALRIHAGAVSRQTETWRSVLLRARALIELTIDWVDEDVPVDVLPEVSELLRELDAGMAGEISRGGPAERMRSGFEVAIVGPPNAGKSSLLNAIAGRDAAIVSEIVGTTRDVIELRFDLGGLPVIFLDTAGIREVPDGVEKIGIERTHSRAAAADLRLVLRSPDAAKDVGLYCDGDIRVWSKCDLGPGEGDVSVSALDGSGLDALLALLRTRLAERVADGGVLGHVRQRVAVQNALEHVRGCRVMLGTEPAEHVAEELRSACRALDSVVGRIGVEDVLGEVFGAFCLGK